MLGKSIVQIVHASAIALDKPDKRHAEIFGDWLQGSPSWFFALTAQDAKD